MYSWFKGLLVTNSVTSVFIKQLIKKYNNNTIHIIYSSNNLLSAIFARHVLQHNWNAVLINQH